tara:strand:+ start:658 stop:1824 length:1167 start_codon:yes stop_codon:yes gene_type:complete
MIIKPVKKPVRPFFSSGPCVKNPLWSAEKVLENSFIGRSHRCSDAKIQLNFLINKIGEILEIPSNYKIAIVPASNTGAFEMALWNFAGAQPIDVLAWESFGFDWAYDILEELNINDVNYLKSNFGSLPDVGKIRKKSDLCFTLNGTTSGVRLPQTDWIPEDLSGITMCDATSALFSQEVDWDKLDVTTFSWQKAMGGEGAHGVIILSPKALKRLEIYNPNWPIPKIFRLKKNGKIIDGIFKGLTINTPSLFCVSDALDSLNWIESIGGIKATIQRANENFKILQNWIDSQHWVENLCKNVEYRSVSSVCIKIIDKDFIKLKREGQINFIKEFTEFLEMEKVAYDIKGHRDAPPSLRVWCGPTVEKEDIKDLLPWLTWSFFNKKKSLIK